MVASGSMFLTAAVRAGESLPPARGVSHSPALYVRGGMNPIGAAIMFAGVLAFLRGSHFAGWLLFIFGGILWVLLPARTPSRTRATKGEIEGQMQALKAQGWVLRERDDNTALLVRQRSSTDTPNGPELEGETFV